MSEQNFTFGLVDDNDESLQTKKACVFGLNHGFITKIAFNPNGGKNNSPANSVDIEMLIGEKVMNRRLYDITGQEVFGRNAYRDIKLKPGDKGYEEAFNEDMTQIMTVIVHALKTVGVTQEQLAAELATPAKDFVDWAKKVTSLLPAGFQKVPVDVFLQYQWNIGPNQTKKFLEIPKNMKGGKFLCPTIKPVGKWTAVMSDEGLSYIDDAGNKHLFTRSKSFMEDKKAIQEFEGNEDGNVLDNAAGVNSSIPNATSAKQSTW